MHDRTYTKTCVTSKDSDQPVHTQSMGRVLIYLSLDSPGDYRRHMIGKDSNQTAQMHRLIRVFAGRTSLIVGFVMHWLI